MEGTNAARVAQALTGLLMEVAVKGPDPEDPMSFYPLTQYRLGMELREEHQEMLTVLLRAAAVRAGVELHYPVRQAYAPTPTSEATLRSALGLRD